MRLFIIALLAASLLGNAVQALTRAPPPPLSQCYRLERTYVPGCGHYYSEDDQ
jgi:hypothetical protein